MMKYRMMAIISIAACAVLQCVNDPVAVEDEKHTPKKAIPVTIADFDARMAQGGVSLIEFYSDECPVCASLTWAIDSMHADFTDNAFVGANNTDNDTLYKQFVVTTVPTYVFFRDGVERTRRSIVRNEPEVYDTLAVLLRELLADTGDSTTPVDTGDTIAPIETPPDRVVMLDKNNFANSVNVGGRVAMIDFFSPTCPACQRMNPTVSALAATFYGTALIAKVDCSIDDTLDAAFSVNYVPTFVFLKSGIEYFRHTGSLPFDSLAAYVRQGLGMGL